MQFVPPVSVNLMTTRWRQSLSTIRGVNLLGLRISGGGWLTILYWSFETDPALYRPANPRATGFLCANSVFSVPLWLLEFTIQQPRRHGGCTEKSQWEPMRFAATAMTSSSGPNSSSVRVRILPSLLNAVSRPPDNFMPIAR